MSLSAKFRYFLISLAFFLISAMGSGQNSFLLHGADRDSLYLPLLKGKKIAVVGNHTSLRRDGTHLVDFLLANKISVVKIFAPEHGFRGTADAGAHIANGKDIKTGLPLVSLYGKHRKPTTEDLRDVDLLLFDIQDVGVRFYTYISTLAYCMEAAAGFHKKIIVLDRPNPHDGYTDGPVLQKEFSSFIGLHRVPVVYGLTIGEYGQMVNGENWLPNRLKADYTVIPMENYHRQQNHHDLPVRPSPNLHNAQAVVLYPSLCFFEGTEVSVGRGTDAPFQQYGSPWMVGQSFSFTPKPSAGAGDPLFNGQLCFGEDLRSAAIPNKILNLDYLLRAYASFKHQEQSFFVSNGFFDKLAGTDRLRKQIISGWNEQQIRASWKKDLQKFEKIRRKYLIYPN